MFPAKNYRSALIWFCGALFVQPIANRVGAEEPNVDTTAGPKAEAPAPSVSPDNSAPADNSAPGDNNEQERKIAREVTALVEQLGDESFVKRQQASARLVEIGVPAKSSLEKAQSSESAEVRYRAARLLQEIDQSTFEQRLIAFAKDADGSRGVTLPGWEAFSQQFGDDELSRELFVKIQTSEADLLRTFAANPKRASEKATGRCMLLWQVQRVRGRQEQIDLGSVAALIYVASHPQVELEGQASNYLISLISQSSIQEVLRSGEKEPLLRRLIGNWIANDSRDDWNSLYQRMMLAARYGLPEGLKPALRIVTTDEGATHYKLYAILILTRFGDEKHIRPLIDLLEDKNVGTRRTVVKGGQRETMEVQIRDVALAALLRLTKQDLKDYGFANPQDNPAYVFHPHSLYFKKDEARDAALLKWKKWAEENLQVSAETRDAPGDESP